MATRRPKTPAVAATKRPSHEVATVSARDARAIAIGAQGLAAPRPTDPPGPAELRALVERLGVVQLDSVNVLVRSHYLPAWSRLGAYDRDALDALAYGPAAGRAMFEFWGHEASWLPLDLQPLMRWRMAQDHRWGQIRRMGKRRAFLAKVLATVEARGPIGAGDLEVGKPGRTGWWEWSEAKCAIEALFWSGAVTTATRKNFERRYDLAHRVIPQRILETPTPREPDAHAQLIERAARAIGIGTEGDLRDYYRQSPAHGRAAIAQLVEAGTLERVAVEGWAKPAYRHAGAQPAAIDPARTALLSPFDSLIWLRDRTERLFGMRYRLEIYTPAHKRVHGYYVLPFLQGDRLTARVDLKSDREGGALLVHAAHAESHASPRDVVGPLAAELRGLATWLGLERVVVTRKGDLGAALAKAVR